MNCERCHDLVDALVDGELSPSVKARVEAHIATCASCREQIETLRRLRATTAALPRARVPARDLWPDLSARLRAAPPRPRRRRWTFVPLAAAAALLAGVFLGRTSGSDTWNVMPLAGSPRVGARALAGDAAVRRGDWIETDASSRARLTIGEIGEVRLAPNSRLRIVTARKSDHRVELARGSLEARIWAPPRLFFVDTAAAEVVDLGCAYTLTVDDQGEGELFVTAGYVALEHGGRHAIVPSGFMCRTRRDVGPGIPYDPAAAAGFRQALNAFDDGDAEPRAAALQRVLSTARPEDAVTLWHLLARTTPDERSAVFDRLAALTPPPAAVTRAGILAGSDEMRRAWARAIGLSPGAGD